MINFLKKQENPILFKILRHNSKNIFFHLFTTTKGYWWIKGKNIIANSESRILALSLHSVVDLCIFSPAPDRGFSSSPRPALPRWKKLRPAHPWSCANLYSLRCPLRPWHPLSTLQLTSYLHVTWKQLQNWIKWKE